MLLNMIAKRPLCDGIRRVVFVERMNFSIIITGKPQTRKSTTGLSLGFGINPKFNMDKDLAIIKTKDFIETLDMGGKRGTVKLLDEFGVGMSHKRWFTFLNQAMNYIIQTHGHKGHVVIVTAPYKDYVDSDSRKLFDMIIEMKNKNDREKYATAQVKLTQYNQSLKKMYYRFPRGRYPDGIIKRITSFKIGYPTEEIMNAYFKRTSHSKEKLKSDLSKEAQMMEYEIKRKLFNPEEYVPKILEEPDKFLKDWQGKKIVVLENIMNNFAGIGRYRAMQIKRVAETKLKELNLD